ncbi:MAG: SRPBCC domain-containing protein [Roseivirga sp.]
MNKTNFETKDNVLTVTRTFSADLNLVWRAWTEADLLDQWWAPSPWKSETSHMDFTEGGYRLYAMVGPEGERHLGRTNYLTISIHDHFSGEDVFCDEDGNVNPELPVATFKNEFEAGSNKTQVTIVTEYASAEHLEQVIQMGMKEGLSAAFESLDAVFDKLKP